VGKLQRIYRGETNIDFIGKRKLWFSLSGAVVLICMALIAFRPAESSCAPPLPSAFKGLSCGIEFKGGVAIQAPIADDGPIADLDDLEVIAEVRDALAPLGADDAQIQIAEADGQRSVIVQTSAVGEAEEQDAVADAVRETTGATVDESTRDQIGRKWGGEITGKAVKALVIFLLVIVAFMSWRFEWKMALAAFVALFHDLIITAGVYALVGFEVTPSTVIAILTILGYSLYDTVVVFDKVEEDTVALASTGRMTYEGAANRALNEVFMRSLNTTLSTLLPVGALLFIGAGLLGADTMKDLALALFVGLMVGAYSSVFLATPVLSVLKEREPRFRNVREKILRDAQRSSLKPATAGAPADAAAGPDESASPAQTPSPAQRAANRPRAGSKKAKRRKKR
jgi:preprotein translocase subunit SecF